MKRRWLIIAMVVLLIIEGTVMPWIIPGEWKLRLVPHFVYIVILLYAVYANRYTALMLGLIFGLLHDMIHYGNMLGVYSFSMGLCAYVIGKIFGERKLGMGAMMIVVLISSFALDSSIYFIYTMFRVNHLPYQWMIYYQMIPSLFLQLFFALIVYVPIRKLLDGGYRSSVEEE